MLARMIHDKLDSLVEVCQRSACLCAPTKTRTLHKCLINSIDAHIYQNINFESCILFMLIKFLQAVLFKQTKPFGPTSTSQ